MNTTASPILVLTRTIYGKQIAGSVVNVAVDQDGTEWVPLAQVREAIERGGKLVISHVPGPRISGGILGCVGAGGGAVTRELWRELLLAGWIPPPRLWLQTHPINGECALLWLVEEGEPFEHGMNAEGYFDGVEWVDFDADSTPIEGHGMTVAAWCHTPGQQYDGHDEIGYFKRMLDNFPAR